MSPSDRTTSKFLSRIPGASRSRDVMAVVLAMFALLAFYVFRPAAPIRLALPMNGAQYPPSKVQDLMWPASSTWPASAYLAVTYGEQHGLLPDVEPAYQVAGRGAVAALMAGASEMAWSFGPPVVEGIARYKDLVVLAVVMRSKQQVRLFVRAENAGDWFTKRVAVMPRTITDSLVFAELRRLGKLEDLKTGSLKLVEVENPENLFLNLVNREVEGAAVPRAYIALFGGFRKTELAYVDVASPDVYPTTGFLVARAESYDRHKDAIMSVLKVFRDYGKRVAAHPREELARMYKLEAGGAPPPKGEHANLPWGPDDFLILTDKDKVREILHFEAKIRVDGGVLAAEPDFGPALSSLDEITKKLKRP
ncbi:MAG: hypothetical protein ACK5JT_10015 [Hyphomicrobiaceae bacterium]